MTEEQVREVSGLYYAGDLRNMLLRYCIYNDKDHISSRLLALCPPDMLITLTEMAMDTLLNQYEIMVIHKSGTLIDIIIINRQNGKEIHEV